MAPLLAAISESLTPTNPFKDVGLGRSPYQRTGQVVMFVCSCPNLAALRHTLRLFLELHSTCVRPFYGGARYTLWTFRAEAGFALHVAFCCIELLSPL